MTPCAVTSNLRLSVLVIKLGLRVRSDALYPKEKQWKTQTICLAWTASSPQAHKLLCCILAEFCTRKDFSLALWHNDALLLCHKMACFSVYWPLKCLAFLYYLSDYRIVCSSYSPHLIRSWAFRVASAVCLPDWLLVFLLSCHLLAIMLLWLFALMPMSPPLFSDLS